MDNLTRIKLVLVEKMTDNQYEIVKNKFSTRMSIKEKAK